MAETVEIIVEGRDRLSGPLGTARAKLEQLGQSIRGTTGGLSGMGAAAQATAAHASGLSTATAHANRSVGMLSIGLQGMVQVAAGIGVYRGVASIMGEVSNAFIGFNAAMEQSKVAFTTMLGGAAQAEAMLKRLYDFAAETPFEFPDVVRATKQLLAYGFAAETVIPTLKSVGDAVSGLGGTPEMISRVIRALGQMQAKGRVTGEEMLQLTETGIPAWKILSEAMGKSTAEVMKLSEKGLIPANKAIQMLVDGMEKRFPNMMALQSRTFTGLMSTLRDRVIGGLAKIGEPFFNAGKAALTKLTDGLASGDLTAGIENLSKNIATALSGIGGIFARVDLSKFREAFGQIDFAAIARGFGNIGSAIGNIVGKIAPVVAEAAGFGASYLVRGIQAVAGALNTMAGGVRQLAGVAWDKIKDGMDKISSIRGPGITQREFFGLSVGEIGGISTALIALRAVLPPLIGMITGLAGAVLGLVGGLGGLAVIAGLTALFVGFNAIVVRLYGSWERFLESVQSSLRWFGALAGVIGQRLGPALGNIGKQVGDALGDVGRAVSGVMDAIRLVLETMGWGNAALKLGQAIGGGIRDGLYQWVPGIKGFFDWLGGLVDEANKAFDKIQADQAAMNLVNAHRIAAIGTGNSWTSMFNRVSRSAMPFVNTFDTVRRKMLEAALAGKDFNALPGPSTSGMDNYADATGKAEDAMKKLRQEMQGIADIKLFGETAVSDELFRMEIEAKRLQLRILEVGGSGSEGAKEYEAALKALQRQMEMTRLKAEIEFEPQKRMIERLVNPIQELSLQEKLDALLQLSPDTINGLANAAQSAGLSVGSVEKLINMGEPDFRTMSEQWIIIADAAGRWLAAIMAARTFNMVPNIPGRASGGPVEAGRPYMVGERGPELFLPQTSGRVVPNTRTNNDNRNVTVNVYANQGNVTDRFAADPRIKEYLKPKPRW